MRKSYYETWNKENSKQKSKRKAENKFVVLRRWQSYNPKLPRTTKQHFKGGGYLLLWEGKGIVVDPGYDFIQNLYDEGFSLGDIDAIVVSHSHPDHDDDLSSLLTLFHEWNEYQENHGQKHELRKKIDLFLNESCFRKFTTWVHSEKVILGRIVPLPLIVWNKDSKSQFVENKISGKRIGPRRGDNVEIDLTGPEGYNLKLEIVPAFDISGTQECQIMHELIKNVERKILCLDAGFNDRKLVSEISQLGMTVRIFPKKTNKINLCKFYFL